MMFEAVFILCVRMIVIWIIMIMPALTASNQADRRQNRSCQNRPLQNSLDYTFHLFNQIPHSKCRI